MTESFDGLADKGEVGVKPRLTEGIVEQIRLFGTLAVTASDSRTWTAGQINALLQDEHGFALNERYLAEALRKNRLSDKRTGHDTRPFQTVLAWRLATGRRPV